MTDLEELKSTWDKSQVRYSKAALNDIFEVKTKRSVRSINRTMLLDYALMFIAAAGLIGLTFFLGLKSRYVITLEILSVTAVMIIHYGIKYSLLNSVDLHTNDLRSSLRKLTRRLTHYLIAYRVLIPLFVGIIYLKIQWNLIEIRSQEWIKSITELIIVIPIVAITFWIVRWISLKMYGKQLKKLRELQEQWGDVGE